VKNNSLPHERGATETDADLTASQIWVEGENEYAFVEHNDVALGDKGDQTALGAVIAVEASVGGMVVGNSVIGHEIGALDTAIRVDGPLYVTDNHYMGVGPRWASAKTPLSNELVIVGTGAIVGNNPMAVDDTGGTSTAFRDVDSERWSMPGVVEVKVGELEITWSSDIEIIEIEARVKVAPTGSTVIIDAHVNDTTTLYTTPGLRPTIATSGFTDTTTPDITTITAGDPVRIDVDQKDSNDVAAGLTVTVRYRRV